MCRPRSISPPGPGPPGLRGRGQTRPDVNAGRISATGASAARTSATVDQRDRRPAQPETSARSAQTRPRPGRPAPGWIEFRRQRVTGRAWTLVTGRWTIRWDQVASATQVTQSAVIKIGGSYGDSLYVGSRRLCCCHSGCRDSHDRSGQAKR